MRAAEAAKDRHELIAALGDALQEVTASEANSACSDYSVNVFLPFLKQLTSVLLAAKPENPYMHAVLWLLDTCAAPESLVSQAMSWAKGDSVLYPLIARPEGKPPKWQRPSFTNGSSHERNGTFPEGRIKTKEAESPKKLRHVNEEVTIETHPTRTKFIWKGAGDETDVDEEQIREDDDDTRPSRDVFFHKKAGASQNAAEVRARIDQRKKRFTVICQNCDVPPPPLQETIALLRTVPVFRDLPDETMANVAKKVKAQTFMADDTIIALNEQNDRLHVVVSGVGAIAVPLQTGTVNTGRYFGNTALKPTKTPSVTQISAFGAPVTTISIGVEDVEDLNIKRHFIEKSGKERMARSFANTDDNMPLNRAESTKRGGTCQMTRFPVVTGYSQTPGDRERIRSALQSNKVLGDVLTLSEAQYEMLADLMWLVGVPKGHVVIEKGSRGDSLFVVQSGHLDCTLDVNFPGEFKIRTGDAFGELGLLYDAPRSATISAACDCHLWVLPRREFQVVMGESSAQKVAACAHMLERIPYLLTLVHARNMDVIAGVVEEVSLLEDEDVCTVGDDDGLLFVLAEGECEAINADTETVRKMGAGDWVGEEQLEKGVAAVQTVRVTSQSATVYVLDIPGLQLAVATIANMGKLGGRRANDSKGSSTLDRRIDHYTKTKVTNNLLQKQMKRNKMKKQGGNKRGSGLGATLVLDLAQKKLEYLGGLGEGSFGYVTLLQNRRTSKMFAVKAVSKEHIIRENLGNMMKNERNIMMLFDSDFIIHLYQSFQDGEFIYLLLEPVLCGELFDVFTNNDMFGKIDLAKFYVACVTLGLEHMHAVHVIYRDLKLENCLLAANGYIKLTDMGIAKVVIGKTYTVCGTADYFAPETLRQHGHNRAVDWWACGVLLFIMCSGRSPFDAPMVEQIYKNIIKGFSRVKFPDTFPSDLTDVIKSLCRKVPEERVTMQKGGVDNLKEMPFFIGFDWDMLAKQTKVAPFIPPAPDMDAIRQKKLSRDVGLDFDAIEPWDGTLLTKDELRE